MYVPRTFPLSVRSLVPGIMLGTYVVGTPETDVKCMNVVKMSCVCAAEHWKIRKIRWQKFKWPSATSLSDNDRYLVVIFLIVSCFILVNMGFILVFAKWGAFRLVYLTYYPSTVGGWSFECPHQWGTGEEGWEVFREREGKETVAWPKEHKGKACQSQGPAGESPELTWQQDRLPDHS